MHRHTQNRRLQQAKLLYQCLLKPQCLVSLHSLHHRLKVWEKALTIKYRRQIVLLSHLMTKKKAQRQSQSRSLCRQDRMTLSISVMDRYRLKAVKKTQVRLRPQRGLVSQMKSYRGQQIKSKWHHLCLTQKTCSMIVDLRSSNNRFWAQRSYCLKPYSKMMGQMSHKRFR